MKSNGKAIMWKDKLANNPLVVRAKQARGKLSSMLPTVKIANTLTCLSERGSSSPEHSSKGRAIIIGFGDRAWIVEKSRRYVQPDEQQSDNEDARTLVAEPQLQLPEGWAECLIPSGHVLYTHRNARVASLIHPASLIDYMRFPSRPRRRRVDSTSLNSARLNNAWPEYFSRAGPQRYVVECDTAANTYLIPSHGGFVQTTYPEGHGPLPLGWERRQLRTVTIEWDRCEQPVVHVPRWYYVDHNTRSTTWRDPRVMEMPGGVQHAQVLAIVADPRAEDEEEMFLEVQYQEKDLWV